MVKIACCNIRDARADDGVNSWSSRRELCLQTLCAMDADVFCFQEMRQNQRDDVTAALMGYDSYGLSENLLATDAPNTIFWRIADFSLISSGGFWLSEQPQSPGSVSWGCQYIRLVNCVVLKHKSGKCIRIINTHLDDSHQFAREQQAQLLVANTGDDNQCNNDLLAECEILCGDLNCDVTNPVMTILKPAGWKDCFMELHKNTESEYTYSDFTYHAFMGPAYDPTQHPDEPQGRIDWIFVRGDVHVSAAEIIRSGDNQRFPSDHYFVSATLLL